MPYSVVKRTGDRPYKIINKITRRIVGTSTTMSDAKRSIGYRLQAEKESAKKKNKAKVGT